VKVTNYEAHQCIFSPVPFFLQAHSPIMNTAGATTSTCGCTSKHENEYFVL